MVPSLALFRAVKDFENADKVLAAVKEMGVVMFHKRYLWLDTNQPWEQTGTSIPLSSGPPAHLLFERGGT